jgi:L-asparagine transporter-like permease
MDNITAQQPQPTSDPTYQMNTLELQEIPKSNYSIVVLILVIIIHIYLIYQTEDIIYRGLLLICLISIVWLLNKKNNNQNIIDDDGINLIEG